MLAMFSGSLWTSPASASVTSPVSGLFRTHTARVVLMTFVLLPATSSVLSPATRLDAEVSVMVPSPSHLGGPAVRGRSTATAGHGARWSAARGSLIAD